MDGATLAQRRKALGLSTVQLAAEVGISHVTVWRLEKTGQTPTTVVDRALEATLARLERDAVESREHAG